MTCFVLNHIEVPLYSRIAESFYQEWMLNFNKEHILSTEIDTVFES